MKLPDGNIAGLSHRVARDLMIHYRRFIVSEETTRDFFDALAWPRAVDAAFPADPFRASVFRKSCRHEDRKRFSRDWKISFQPMSVAEAEALMSLLQADGWLETNVGDIDPFDESKLVLTDKARQFSVKRLVPRIDRKRADKIVKEMIQRIEQINNEPSFLYDVAKVTAFGSYASASNDLGDVDLCVELSRRYLDNQEHESARKAFNKSTGKRFSTYIAELFYPQAAIKLRIKNRSPYISLHEKDDLELGSDKMILYEFKRSPEQSLRRL